MRTLCAAVAALVLSSIVSPAAHAADYTVQINAPITITNVIAIDRTSSGTLSFSWPYSLHQGFNTLTNASQAPDVTSYFLAGTFFSTDDNKNHTFFTMNATGAEWAAGKKFSETFVPFREPQAVTAITNITSGTDVSGGLAFLTSFANTHGNYLFTNFDEPGTAMQFTVSIPVGVVNPVPVPAAVMQGGLALLGLAGFAGVKRFARRRSA